MPVTTKMKRMLLEKDARTQVHLLRASVASGTAFAVEFFILFALTELLGLHYLVGAGIGFLTGTVILYFLSVHWVFHSRKIADPRFEFSAFLAISGVALAANAGLLLLFTEVLGLHYLLSRMAAALCVFAGNFAMKKLLLFR